MPENLAEKKRLARALIGHLVQFHSVGPDAAPMRVLSVTLDGMVEIEGYSGLFAPHLFRIVDEK
jgi:uncharacterized membrane protein